MTTYGDWHTYLRKMRGRAADHKCNDCGKDASDWALIEDRASEILTGRHGTRYSHRYALELNAYVPMCRRCHLKLDKTAHQATGERHANRTHCKHGHLFDEQNTLWIARGPDRPKSRQCRTCVNESKRRFRERARNV